MTSKRLLVAALVAVGGVLAVWFWFRRENVHSEPSSPSVHAHSHADGVAPEPAVPREPIPRLITSVAPGAPLVRTSSTAPTPLAEAPAIATAHPETQPEAKADLENVRFMIRDFRTRMNENPVGSNAEIMRAVMGGNPAGARLGPPVGQSLNADGELVDHWGTPYFFHQLSKTSMEIRSAGPDRQMWTADDLVTK